VIDHRTISPYNNPSQVLAGALCSRAPGANNESSEVLDIIKPGRRVKVKGYRQ